MCKNAVVWNLEFGLTEYFSAVVSCHDLITCKYTIIYHKLYTVLNGIVIFKSIYDPLRVVFWKWLLCLRHIYGGVVLLWVFIYVYYWSRSVYELSSCVTRVCVYFTIHENTVCQSAEAGRIGIKAMSKWMVSSVWNLRGLPLLSNRYPFICI